MYQKEEPVLLCGIIILLMKPCNYFLVLVMIHLSCFKLCVNSYPAYLSWVYVGKFLDKMRVKCTVKFQALTLVTILIRKSTFP